MIGNGNVLTNIYSEVKEIEHHLHNNEIWFGNGAVEDSLTPYTLISGNGIYGTAVELLAPGDTPFVAGQTRFDPHRVLPVSIDTGSLYLVRLIWDEVSAAAGVTARQYTTFTVLPTGVGSNIDGSITDVIAKRIYSGVDYLWAECKNASNLAEIDILIGIHEYLK